MQKRATEEPELRAHALYTMWEHLEPAATKAGVPLENLRAQLTEECVPFSCMCSGLIDARYGMDPLTAAPPPPRNDAERAARTAVIERRKAGYKREMMEMMRKMRDMGVPIPLDPRTGDVARDDAKNGESVVLVTRVDKETGLKELESW